MPHNQMRRGSRSSCTAPGAASSELSVLLAASMACPSCSTSVQRNTSETPKDLRYSRRMASVNWMACMESRPCKASAPWPPQMRSTKVVRPATGPFSTLELPSGLSPPLLLKSPALVFSVELPLVGAMPKKRASGESSAVMASGRKTLKPMLYQGFPPSQLLSSTSLHVLPRSTTAAFSSNTMHCFHLGGRRAEAHPDVRSPSSPRRGRRVKHRPKSSPRNFGRT
mmetsp:Transcript_93513/g.270161  ORF Transcript_93513/g.270161 Transcript_93513/m.270161 type:complete len:225 (+) Transcript_93513:610-1284(+)